ncbi:SCO family protein [Arenimonas alkanexedens]
MAASRSDATDVSKPAGFGLDQDAAFALSHSVVGTKPTDHVMIDQDQRPASLAEYLGKPLLVNFIYTGCFQVCPTNSRALSGAVKSMRARFGNDQFNIVSIGFDQPTDSPASLGIFAKQQRIDAANWRFLSPRAEDVPSLARDFGFSYAKTPIGFEHTLQVSILDAEGRIYRQVYGDGFAADSLGEPLKQLITGNLLTDTQDWGDLLGRVRILCSVYDPVTGTYQTDYTLYMEFAGGITFVLAMLWLVLSEWRNRRRSKRLAAD